MTITRHNQVSASGERALENSVVVRIGLDYVELDFGFHNRSQRALLASTE
jgi:hypothetical protein